MSEYRVVSAASAEALEVRVAEAMAEGWTPSGGIASSPNGIFTTFYQSLVRSSKTKPAKLVKRS